MIITAVNEIAHSLGIAPGMAVADARMIIPRLEVLDDKPGLTGKLLKKLAQWCIRFTPCAGIDPHEGLMLDVSGCAHLWGGDTSYLREITLRLRARGYHIRAAIADTIGAAWALSRFSKENMIAEPGTHPGLLLSFPPEALRLEHDNVELLRKLGMTQIRHIVSMPKRALRRRFGLNIIRRLDQAFGQEEEKVKSIQPAEPFQERLTCLEPIITRTGIEIGLQQLLHKLCSRLRQEQKGLSAARFSAFRVDGTNQRIEIGTNRPTNYVQHLYKLFELKLSAIEPALGIELFTLEAQKVERVSPEQEKIWDSEPGPEHDGLSELIDRITGKFGSNRVHRYLPDEHYLPERSITPVTSLDEKPVTSWLTDKPRPVILLYKPECIEVTAPIPDYPPMLFRHNGKLHTIIKAEGPERIEQEWWLNEGKHRDYYCVEDEHGHRYWLFRAGHYTPEGIHQWYLHGYFA